MSQPVSVTASGFNEALLSVEFDRQIALVRKQYRRWSQLAEYFAATKAPVLEHAAKWIASDKRPFEALVVPRRYVPAYLFTNCEEFWCVAVLQHENESSEVIVLFWKFGVDNKRNPHGFCDQELINDYTYPGY